MLPEVRLKKAVEFLSPMLCSLLAQALRSFERCHYCSRRVKR
jgi:hypothetical protein